MAGERILFFCFFLFAGLINDVRFVINYLIHFGGNLIWLCGLERLGNGWGSSGKQSEHFRQESFVEFDERCGELRCPELMAGWPLVAS